MNPTLKQSSNWGLEGRKIVNSQNNISISSIDYSLKSLQDMGIDRHRLDSNLNPNEFYVEFNTSLEISQYPNPLGNTLKTQSK